jgi:peptidoglycan/LPS O-acetylase OafA/YrhL
VNSSIQVPISLWRSFLLIPDRTLPLLAVGRTLVHEMCFYLVFAIFLALRIPIFPGLVGWGVILLLIMTILPDQVAISPLLRLATSPLTAEFMIGAIVGILWRKHRASGVIAVGAVGLGGLTLSIVYIAPMLSLATSLHLDGWRVVIFGIPSALLIYAITGVERLRPAPRPTALLAESAIGRTPYI